MVRERQQNDSLVNGYNQAADIMYPAWAFHEGGPWLSVIKTWCARPP